MPELKWTVMVSSTTRDLVNYRQAVSELLAELQFDDVSMEQAPAPNMDEIDISMALVAKCDIFICLVGKRYGTCIPCSRRNPDNVSVVELEHRRAVELDKSRHYFLIQRGFDHGEDVDELLFAERHDGRKAKLDTFRASLGRAVMPIASVEELKKELRKTLLNRRDELNRSATPSAVGAFASAGLRRVATGLVALNAPYPMKSKLVGRQRELALLDAFAQDADHSLLLIQAIGGMGKSRMLWHWADRHAPNLGCDWAGIFWYTFDEKGATLKNLLVEALSEITGASQADLEQKRLVELGNQLFRIIDKEPFLLILDGMERLLGQYDTLGRETQAEREAAGRPDRSGRQGDECIDPDDDVILQRLAQSRKSKIVASSRIFPRALTQGFTKRSQTPIDRVRRQPLDGLEPEDAARLLQLLGVHGDVKAMEDYLERNFEGYPLAIQVIPGLIEDFLENEPRGIGEEPDLDFDLWVKHKAGGQRPELVSGAVSEKVEALLQVAFASLEDDDARLLAAMALCNSGYQPEILQVLNPHCPADRCEDPAWHASSDGKQAAVKLRQMLDRLSKRGLVQRDPETGALAMHPAIRSVVCEGSRFAECKHWGAQRVAAAFDRYARNPRQELASKEDIGRAIDCVVAYALIGRLDRAIELFVGGLSYALHRSGALDASTKLLRLFMTDDFSTFRDDFSAPIRAFLHNEAAILLHRSGDSEAALDRYRRAIAISAEQGNVRGTVTNLRNLTVDLIAAHNFREAQAAASLGFRVAAESGIDECLGWALAIEANLLTRRGMLDEAQAKLDSIPAIGKDWNFAEQFRAELQWERIRWRIASDTLDLPSAEAALDELRRSGLTDYMSDGLWMVGGWLQRQGGRQGHEMADALLSEAVKLMRQTSHTNAPAAEAQRAISLIALGRAEDARQIAGAVEGRVAKYPSILARLYFDLGDAAKAREFALAGYRQAWADGPPYCHARQLADCRDLLARLGEAEPRLPPYDHSRDVPPPYADEVEGLIGRLKVDRAKREDFLSTVGTRLAKARASGWHLPPLLPQAWQDETGGNALNLLARIFGWKEPFDVQSNFPRERQVDRVRAARLGCYSDAMLVEVQGYTDDGRPGLASFLVHDRGIVALNGTSPPIHDYNAASPPDFSTETARQDYIQLFMNHVCGEEGRFQLVGDRQTLAQRLRNSARIEEVADSLQPLTPIGEEQDDVGTHFRYVATVLYSDALFRAELRLSTSGMIEMLDDEALAGDLDVRREDRDGLLVIERKPASDQEA
ncbi:DUF4062 domain-containing protein [Altererythrobacter lauratis]|uniref:DUF4062 domain-containing protein n=1 Tax=Alteraurantiacibacter lauratis TaxID=2054627 RepID=A0ABV7EEJ0_9SPHN